MDKRLVYLILLLVFCLSSRWVLADVTSDREAKLNAELQQVEQEIAGQKTLLTAKQKETASIKRDVDILTYKITTAQLNISTNAAVVFSSGFLQINSPNTGNYPTISISSVNHTILINIII